MTASASLGDDIQRLIAAGNGAGAAALLDDAAQGGDASACFILAQWLVVGAPIPRDVPRALRLLGQGRTLGHPQCALMEMAFIANGSGGVADWPAALDLLRQFAARDGYGARLLALIDRMDIDEMGRPRPLPAAQLRSKSPRVSVVAGLFTADECAHLRAIASPSLQPAHIVDPRTGRKTAHPIRDSAAATLGPPQEDLVARALLIRIAAASGTQVDQGEALNVLRYEPGQQYRPHLDVLPPPHSQRIRTVIVYLNDDYDGGETQFDIADIIVRGRTGDALIFDNVQPDGRPDAASRHAGLPVLTGTKWIATRWIRERAYSAWTDR